MACNCSTPGCAEIFGDRVARREAKHFRKRGLPARAQRLLDALAARVPLHGLSAIEVGAGVGGFTISMLERGIEKATIIDAAPAYVEAAQALASERGVHDALTVRVGDFAEDEPTEAADVVVMDRVVCCYPSWRGLLEQATRTASSAIALSYPRKRWSNSFGTRMVNLLMWIRRSPFRVFVHPPRTMRAFLESRGFSAEVVGSTAFWELVVARPDADHSTSRVDPGGTRPA